LRARGVLVGAGRVDNITTLDVRVAKCSLTCSTKIRSKIRAAHRDRPSCGCSASCPHALRESVRGWNGDSLRQAELPENGREARITAERRHFRIPDKERDTMRYDVGRPVQRLERAILVPKGCVDDRQAKRIVVRQNRGWFDRGGRLAGGLRRRRGRRLRSHGVRLGPPPLGPASITRRVHRV
jgi:hypothetical protein